MHTRHKELINLNIQHAISAHKSAERCISLGELQTAKELLEKASGFLDEAAAQVSASIHMQKFNQRNETDE